LGKGDIINLVPTSFLNLLRGEEGEEGEEDEG
jgi:hypothetical protein